MSDSPTLVTNITAIIQNAVVAAVQSLYGFETTVNKVNISATRKEYKGDFSVVVFPYTKVAKKKPELIAEEIGNYLLKLLPELADFNVIKGFLNLELNKQFWNDFLLQTALKSDFGIGEKKAETVMVEFSSPNTNKPLHLGHIRNILLGWSCAQILEMAGYKAIKTQIVNDRGIAICKTMLAWKKFAQQSTPDSTNIKGDHFVGTYYVRFAQELAAEYKAWQSTKTAQNVFENKSKEGQNQESFFKKYKDIYFNEYSLLGKEAKELLLKWEANDPEVRTLWKQMNDWVYKGFEETYKALSVNFDKLYYESNTYLLGKDMIKEGVEKGVFQQEGKRVFIDLEDKKLGVKTVLKTDGTSTYTSQDIGTAKLRYNDFGMEKVVYVVGDEQNNHFQVLFEILKRLEEPYAEGLHHLSYGMVDLPTGRMKSREGTVVDADDLIKEVVEEARKGTKERGDVGDFSATEQTEIIRKIGLAALKYFILKVNPKKRMVFDPKDSVDMQGNTGPYIQNAYVRSKAVINKVGQADLKLAANYLDIKPVEQEILVLLYAYPSLIQTAAENYDPSIIANFCYDLAKLYHKFYHDHPILRAESPEAQAFRLALSQTLAQVLKAGMKLLGIGMPERM